MDNYLGDLADIVRASGGVNNDNPTTTTTTTTTRTAASGDQMSTWNFGSPDTRTSNTHQSYEYNDLYTFSDPLLPDIDPISSPGPFSLNMGAQDGSNDNTISTEAFSSNTGLLLQQQMQQAAATTSEIYHLGHEYQPKLAQIPPSNIPSHSNNNNNNNRNNNCNSNNSNNNSNSNSNSNNNYVGKRSFGFMSSETVGVNNAASSSSSPKEGFIGGHQIPSPRNSGIKRRKSQAKKVVCIPATGAANSRQTGEVVPSDLWAWRKYGQKPIKGSPYPRGYYRCSSSKGCSARKQVERSRTDPNMLVITYTSEHNHPWPTQRNALAGSSRSSHPSKEKTLVKDEINDKEEQYDVDTRNGPIQSPVNYAAPSNPSKKSSLMKEEEATTLINDVQVQNKLEENNVLDYDGDDHQLVNNNTSYRPTIQQCDQDFFKDLVEFEGGDDPLNLLFAQEAKGSDPLFSGFFDWTTQNFATTKDVVDDCDPNNGSTSR